MGFTLFLAFNFSISLIIVIGTYYLWCLHSTVISVIIMACIWFGIIKIKQSIDQSNVSGVHVSLYWIHILPDSFIYYTVWLFCGNLHSPKSKNILCSQISMVNGQLFTCTWPTGTRSIIVHWSHFKAIISNWHLLVPVPNPDSSCTYWLRAILFSI